MFYHGIDFCDEDSAASVSFLLYKNKLTVVLHLSSFLKHQSSLHMDISPAYLVMVKLPQQKLNDQDTKVAKKFLATLFNKDDWAYLGDRGGVWYFTKRTSVMNYNQVSSQLQEQVLKHFFSYLESIHELPSIAVMNPLLVIPGGQEYEQYIKELTSLASEEPEAINP